MQKATSFGKAGRDREKHNEEQEYFTKKCQKKIVFFCSNFAPLRLSFRGKKFFYVTNIELYCDNIIISARTFYLPNKS